MDDSKPYANSVSEDAGIEFYVNSPHVETEKSDLQHEECACTNAGETAKVMSGKDADDDSVIRKDSSNVEELGTAVDRILHIQDAQEGVSGHVPTSEKDELNHQEKENMSQELKTNHASASTATIQKSLSKWATFPSSEKTLLSPVSMDEGAESICIEPPGQSSLKSQNPVCTRSMSLPTSLKLISAMKGGREQQGTPRTGKMNVKWAADVYDPPSTSMSHTVKNHHQRPKCKKKDQKHKHKGKSTRGSSSEKKHHANRRSIANANLLPLRLQAPGNRLLQAVDGFDQMSQEVEPTGDKVPALDGSDRLSAGVIVSSVGISNQDKCGRSFFEASSLAKVHLSATEAT
ncbi:uncharacterized protein LOC131252982 [Magnolia sinica]|uniref:uncharacterized protein LOC131252982 n=1 Tax=Magnolia sinica TaxID=86752 RepID=UPI002657FB3F|nr:uncharacterized protein LOC131252982 [Magnolia sinica]XP_058109783.1 uncharacterized protein LOC131252982 [Magnolia sinica]